MVMGVAQRIGGRRAVFFVVPLLAGIAILASYMMGLRVAGQTAGASAAVLLATSPSFLFQLTSAPMSDVAVMAWWALALALLLFDSRTAAWLAGCAASLAVLTRPNLAPLALIPIVTLLASSVRERPSSSRARQRALFFVVGVVPGCAVVAALNALWYGSPVVSGYGRPADLYMWQNVGPNLLRYPAWVFESESPIVLGGVRGAMAAIAGPADRPVVALFHPGRPRVLPPV
jgi:4-amino-4-deoxy-L-arabinose transferase-like glycosyltransferase